MTRKVVTSHGGISVGDIVRVRHPENLLASIAVKVKDRDATVEHIWIPDGWTEARVRVRFHKRNGRGKEFHEFFRPHHLVRKDTP